MPTTYDYICTPEPSDELKVGRFRGWWQQVKPATAAASRRVTEPILKVGAMGMNRAKQAGQATARKVIGLQRSANLPEKMVEKSARTTLERPMNRESDRSWQAGYRETVMSHAPYLFVAKEPEVEDRELEL